jgi:pyrroline-5-carboxylate reductase
MPNIAATVNESMTGIHFNKNVSEEQKKIAISLFATIGPVVHVSTDSAMDIVTAISGSGPAYVFYLMETLADVAVKVGLPEHYATIMAKQTFYGASLMAVELANKSPADLRHDVTSKAGTTEAALKVLMKDNELEKILETAIKAAIDRAKELQ